MSSRLLTPSLRAIATRHTVVLPTVTRRVSIASSSSNQRLQETACDENPDLHKQDLLAKQKSGKGHWKPELASESEAAVKADRHTQPGISLEEMQERTKHMAEEKRKNGGTSVEDGLWAQQNEEKKTMKA